MIVVEFEKSFKKDIMTNAQEEILTPKVLEIFQENAHKDLRSKMYKVDLNKLININNRYDYDKWYDQTLSWFHEDIFSMYKDQLKVNENNPYTYSAKFLNQYIRILSWYSHHDLSEAVQFFVVQHPVMSKGFFKVLNDIGFDQLTDIKNRHHYFSAISHYRMIIDEDEFDEYSIGLLNLKLGIDI